MIPRLVLVSCLFVGASLPAQAFDLSFGLFRSDEDVCTDFAAFIEQILHGRYDGVPIEAAVAKAQETDLGLPELEMEGAVRQVYSRTLAEGQERRDDQSFRLRREAYVGCLDLME